MSAYIPNDMMHAAAAAGERLGAMECGALPPWPAVYCWRDFATSARGFNMPKNTFVLAVLLLLLVSAASAQTGGPSPPQAPGLSERSVACRVMEVFRAERLGTMAAIFHQRDKADGPRLGELLLAHSGAEVEFETPDGQRHRATVGRMKSCFGRGLLLFAAGEARLAEKEEFVLRFPRKN
jgi:hypothetical protein